MLPFILELSCVVCLVCLCIFNKSYGISYFKGTFMIVLSLGWNVVSPMGPPKCGA